jgi:iron complex transport system substrate-binding protein
MTRAFFLPFLAAFSVLASSPMAAEWRYEDGAGVVVTLPEPPQRIIAHASVAAALIPYGIVPVGILLDGPPSRDRSLDAVDVSDIPVVSRGWFELDAEMVLNLEPDIIITEYSLTEKIYQGGTHEDAIFERLNSIAPIIGIPRSTSIVNMLETYGDVAASLGADTETPQLLAERARFEQSVAQFREVVAAKPDLTVLALSPYASGLSIGVPDYFGELHDWQSWGLDIVSPEAAPGTSYFSLSWENAETYPADIMLLDDRWETSALTTIQDHPIGQRLPAISAGQTGDWPAEWIRTYGSYAEEIDNLANLVRDSDEHLVD